MLTRKGFVIEKAEYESAALQQMVRELTVSVPSTFPCHGVSHTTLPSFPIFIDTPNRMCIPRYYAMSVKKLTACTVKNKEHVVQCPNLEFVGCINASKQQDKAIVAAKQAFEVHGGGVLSLPTGYGKTVVAINLMCALKLKTLIVVHKEFLLSQWEERIRQFCPLARIGYLRQNVTDTSGRDVVIGMLQSVLCKDYSPEMLAEFGLVIFDEVHHLSAPTFSRCLFSLCAPYILGLSATPERKDKLDWVLEYFIGPVFFKVRRTEDAHVQVIKVSYHLDLDDCGGDLPRAHNGRYYDATQITTLLCNNTSRTAFLSALIKSILDTSPQRKVLVLSDRREHCVELATLLNATVFHTDARCAAAYMGGMKKSALKEAENATVIMATYSFANEGLDIPGLDTLVYATPKADVVQSAGRILRDGGKGQAGGQHTPHDNRPQIYDVVDSHKYFAAKYKTRCAFYRQSGFEVSTFTGQLTDVHPRLDSCNLDAPLFVDELESQ